MMIVVFAIACTLYDCGTAVSSHIPSYAQPTTGSDHHLIVITGNPQHLWLPA